MLILSFGRRCLPTTRADNCTFDEPYGDEHIPNRPDQYRIRNHTGAGHEEHYEHQPKAGVRDSEMRPLDRSRCSEAKPDWPAVSGDAVKNERERDPGSVFSRIRSAVSSNTGID